MIRAYIFKFLAAFTISTTLMLSGGVKVLANSVNTQDFSLSSFTADYHISRDSNKVSRLDVTETIVAEFTNLNQNRGIYRYIPNSYQDHSVYLEIESIRDEYGFSHPYTREIVNDNLVLKIGDPNKYQYGSATYKISYSMKDVINFQELDEFYWDINGSGWNQSIRQVTSRLHVPDYLADALTDQVKCFSGVQKSTEQNCRSEIIKANSGIIVETTSQNLAPEQGLTVVAAFNKNSFSLSEESKKQLNGNLIKRVISVIFAISIPLLTFFHLFKKWLKEGRDPKGKGVIVPEYMPPKDLSPLEAKFLIQPGIDSRSITAQIIQSAIEGKLHIIDNGNNEKDTPEYSIKIAQPLNSLSKSEFKLFSSLFSGNPTPGATLKTSKDTPIPSINLYNLNKTLGEQLKKNGFYNKTPDNARQKPNIIAVITMVIGIICLVSGAIWPAASLITTALIAFFFAAIMPARTLQGVQVRDYLLGLKEYIKLAEKDRIAYLQSPQGAIRTLVDYSDRTQKVELFEKLLPYAIIFSLENKWIEQMKDLYTTAPEWINSNSFNSATLANSISSIQSGTQSAIAPAHNSSGSGFSGGSSGGGGGGGGGGGW